MEALSDLVFMFCVLPFAVLLNFFTKSKFRNLILLTFSFIVLLWTCSVRLVLNLFLMSSFVYVAVVVNCIVKSKKLQQCVCYVLVFFIVLLRLVFVPMGKVSSLFFGFESAVVSLVCMANISYLIDVLKKYANKQESFVKFLTYVFMLPKLFLGPVVIYYKFQSQLANKKVSFSMLSEGIGIFIVGFAKKVIFANEFYDIYKLVINQTASGLPVLTAWLGACAGFFSFVFNFSGYSDMAIGLGKMFGFNLPSNVKSLACVGGVVDFFNRVNFLVLNYLKNYIFPWGGRSYKFKVAKICLIAFFYMFFFEENYVPVLAVMFFLSLVLLEKFLFKILDFELMQYFKKSVTFVLLLVGVILFQQNGTLENLGYLWSMFGMSGILIDASFIFLIMFIKFLVMIFVLAILNFIKVSLGKTSFFNFIIYFKPIGLVLLFLVSLIFRLSQNYV